VLEKVIKLFEVKFFGEHGLELHDFDESDHVVQGEGSHCTDQIEDEEALWSPNIFEVGTEHDKQPHIKENMKKIAAVMHEKMRHYLIRLKKWRINVVCTECHFEVKALASQDEARYKKCDIEQKYIFGDLREVLKHD
jgi:hypothetical protein